MRSYIFTPLERETIERFFEGKVKVGDDVMRQIVVRLKSFRDLASDVNLYLRLTEAITATST